MIRLLDKTKTSWFNYFYVFCIIIYAGKATIFARSLGDIQTVGNAFGMIITLLFYLNNNIKFNRYYLISLLVFLIYAGATSLNNKMINPRWISQWLIWLTIAYGMCQGLGKKLFILVETVLCHLCVIALVLWILHLFSPSFLEEIVYSFEFSRPYAEDGNVSANMIFYTLGNDQGRGLNEYAFILRNSGFAWEPGAFASFICLGLFCNILRTRTRIKNNFARWILLIALLSSQSTTGFMTLIFMLAFWMFVYRKFGWGILLIILSLSLFTLPFVSNKLLAEVELMSSMDTNITGSVGRFYSLQLNYQEFLRHPLLGLGGWSEGTWLKQHGYDIVLISGIGELLSQYGAIMTILFIYLLVNSCKKIKIILSTNLPYILIPTILGMMFSYSLWTSPIYISFWMFGTYFNKALLRKIP